MVQSKELPLIAGRGNTSDEQERWSCHNTENMSVAYIVGNVQDLFCRIRKSRHIVAQTALQNDFFCVQNLITFPLTVTSHYPGYNTAL